MTATTFDTSGERAHCASSREEFNRNCEKNARRGPNHARMIRPPVNVGLPQRPWLCAPAFRACCRERPAGRFLEPCPTVRTPVVGFGALAGAGDGGDEDRPEDDDRGNHDDDADGGHGEHGAIVAAMQRSGQGKTKFSGRIEGLTLTLRGRWAARDGAGLAHANGPVFGPPAPPLTSVNGSPSRKVLRCDRNHLR